MNTQELFLEITSQIKNRGYYLNPDLEFVNALLEGLLINRERYGYMACPCRLASGVKEKDLDLICPCDYRDQDLEEYGACFCGLYVNQKIAEGEQKLLPVPERRAASSERKKMEEPKPENRPPQSQNSYPIWRCKVCGYLCARKEPPGKCPICQVDKERFEELQMGLFSR